MARQAGRLRHELKEVFAPVHRLDGTNAQQIDIGFLENGLNEVNKAQTAGQIASPASEIDTAEDDLAVVTGEVADLGNDIGQGGTPTPTADSGDDAEGAAIAASVLDLEVGPGTVFACIDDRTGAELSCDRAGMNAAVILDLVHDRGDLGFVGIADDPVNTFDGCDFVGRTLGVAAGYEQLSAGVVTLHIADHAAGVHVSAVGDSAGVQDNEVSICRGGGSLPAGAFKLRFDGRSVGL